MRKLSLVCLFTFVLTSTSVRAAEAYEWRFARTTTDIFIARPFTFFATVLGGALWTVVVSAPHAATLSALATSNTRDAILITPLASATNRNAATGKHERMTLDRPACERGTCEPTIASRPTEDAEWTLQCGGVDVP